MIISKDNRYLFVEVPRTGSTAISAELLENYNGESILNKHSTIYDFYKFATPVQKKYRKFCGIRNPLDDFVSDYEKVKINHRGHFTNEAEFQRNGGWVTEQRLEQFRFVQGGASFEDYFQRYCKGVYINQYHCFNDSYTYILRFETLLQEFSAVLGALGMEELRVLPMVNKTSGKAYWLDYYTPRIQADAWRYFGPYMLKFGYEKPSEWPIVDITNERRDFTRKSRLGRYRTIVKASVPFPITKLLKS